MTMADSDSSWTGYGLTKAFWDSDRWLPDRCSDGGDIIYSIRSSLEEMNLHGHDGIMVHGDVEKYFSEEILNQFGDSGAWAVFPSLTTASPRLDRLQVMLVNIVYHAWLDRVVKRQSCLAIITTLSNDDKETDMLLRVLGSLTARSVPVVLAVPDVDGIHSIFTENSDSAGRRIPVWPIPGLFDDPVEQVSHSKMCFLEPPKTDGFTMPENVDTCAFWDLEDYPLPPGLDLVTFVRNITSYAETSTVSIYVYVVKEEDAALLKDLENIRVVREAPTDKVARLAKMMMDMLLWSMDNNRKRPRPRPDLVVISKVLEDDIFDFVVRLGHMRMAKCNVLLALPDTLPPPETYHFPTVPWDRLTLSSLGKRKSRDDGVLTPTPLL